jgi:polysaccharide export outer membrane protein
MGRDLRFVYLLFAILVSCATSGNYVWVQELPPSAPVSPRDEHYLINVGDTLAVRVFEQEAMSSKVKVRADGRVALPIIGEFEVRGKRPFDVARELEGKLKEFVVAPKITINIEKFAPLHVAVLGEVTHPGTYPLEPAAGVLQALASAGGFTEYASKDRIFVLRKTPALKRVRFTFDALSRNEPRAAMFALQTGDVVVVE